MPISPSIPPDTSVGLWLAANGLDAMSVLAMLAIAAPLAPLRDADGGSETPALSPGAVRRWCAEAFSSAWPALDEIVRGVCDEAPVELDPGTDWRPRARDNGPGKHPTIIVPWRRGDARDAIALAHELAHAVQIVASYEKTEGGTMPPVAREVCAFLGERALLAYLEDRPEGGAVRARFVAEDRVYLGQDAARLIAAFADPDAAYDYRWNYPMARWLARRAPALGDPAEAAALLRSGPNAPERLRPMIEAALASQNPLPPVVARDEPGSLTAYRQIGIAAGLEIARGEECGPETIAAFHRALLEGLLGARLAIGLDDEARPFGWAIGGHDEDGRPRPIRLAAPFGDPAAMAALAARRLAPASMRGGGG